MVRLRLYLIVGLLACLCLPTVAVSSEQKGQIGVLPDDTVEVKPRFEVSKTSPNNESDLAKKTADLKDP